MACGKRLAPESLESIDRRLTRIPKKRWWFLPRSISLPFGHRPPHTNWYTWIHRYLRYAFGMKYMPDTPSTWIPAELREYIYLWSIDMQPNLERLEYEKINHNIHVQLRYVVVLCGADEDTPSSTSMLEHPTYYSNVTSPFVMVDFGDEFGYTQFRPLSWYFCDFISSSLLENWPNFTRYVIRRGDPDWQSRACIDLTHDNADSGELQPLNRVIDLTDEDHE